MKRGFTLLELIISIVLLLAVLNTAFSIFSSAVMMNRQIIAEKELIEVGEFLQHTLTREFSRAKRIEAVLDKDNAIHTHIGEDIIDIRCIKLIRSKNITFSGSYKEELIFLKDYEDDERRSVWIHKNSNGHYPANIKIYRSYSSYEAGTHLKSMKISREQDNIYRIALELEYFDTEITYGKNFLVKLQD